MILRKTVISSALLISLVSVGCTDKKATAGCDQTKFDCTPVLSASEAVAVAAEAASEAVAAEAASEAVAEASASETEIENSESSLIEENNTITEVETVSSNQDLNTPPQFKYQLFSKPQTISGVTIYKTFLKILSMEDNIKIDNLIINRGRCSYQHFWGKSHLSYGSSVEYYLHCDQGNILEIEIHLADGRSVTINP